MAGDMNDAVAGVRDLMLGVFRFTHVSWLGRTSLVLVLFMAGAAHGEPPLALTEGKPVSLRILAAKLRAGGTYPPMPECVAPGARCLDPPPFWLKAQVLATVHGDPVPSDIEVSGAEHFGMRGYAGLDQPVLLLVRTDGLHYEMARNSRVAAAPQVGRPVRSGREPGIHAMAAVRRGADCRDHAYRRVWPQGAA
ncbi:hypothetical protein LP420_25730 [Massilia sp. B-10]|nr:hypothetical protein LP420_25730 [Massilia sp. B-10]